MGLTQLGVEARWKQGENQVRAIFEIRDKFDVSHEYWLWSDGTVSIDDESRDTIYTTLDELSDLLNALKRSALQPRFCSGEQQCPDKPRCTSAVALDDCGQPPTDENDTYHANATR